MQKATIDPRDAALLYITHECEQLGDGADDSSCQNRELLRLGSIAEHALKLSYPSRPVRPPLYPTEWPAVMAEAERILADKELDTIKVDCPTCGTRVQCPIVNGGSGYNDEFGQVEYWWEAEGVCPKCAGTVFGRDGSL